MNLSRVVELMARGLPAKVALDYVVVEELGADPEDWATIRNVKEKRSIEHSVGRAQRALEAQYHVQDALNGKQSLTSTQADLTPLPIEEAER